MLVSELINRIILSYIDWWGRSAEFQYFYNSTYNMLVVVEDLYYRFCSHILQSYILCIHLRMSECKF